MQFFNEKDFLKELHDECTAEGFELLKAVPVSINNGLSNAYVLAIRSGADVHGEVIIPVPLWDITGKITYIDWAEEFSEIDSDMLPVAAPPEILDLLTTPAGKRERKFIAEKWRKWSRLVYEGVYSEAGQAE